MPRRKSMARESDHIRLANRNHDALLHLIGDSMRSPEWITTIAFYKAIHVVEAVFAVHNWHSTSHDKREMALKANPYKGIWNNYSHLLSASKVARYLADSRGDGYSQFSDLFSAAQVKKKLVAKRLYGVEQNAMAFLSAASRSQLKQIDPAKLK